MTKSAAVVGAGVFGRLLALSLGRAGWTVTIFDRHGWDDRSASCFAAAGLLTPAIESIHDISRSLFTLGLRSIDLWSDLIPTLKSHVTLGRQGTIHVGFGQDSALLHELHDKIVRRLPGASSKIINAEQIRLFEPALSKSGFHEALYLPTDGYIQNHAALTALQSTLLDEGVSCRMATEIVALDSGVVNWGEGVSQRFDHVFDCRGMGARNDLPHLRGVRGELIDVYAPEVELQRPIHVVHGRYPIYVVPRGQSIYAIGATNIESDSSAPITVKAAMELLSSAYSLHSGFRYAQITRLVANCRPSFPDNMPKVTTDIGLWRLNGLYRHGFLLAPVVVDCVMKRLSGRVLSADEMELFDPSLRLASD